MNKENLYLIAAGGTGGHVIPATLLAEELKKRGHSVVFVTDLRGKAYVSKALMEEPQVLPLVSRSGGVGAKVKWILSLLKSFWAVRRVLKKRDVTAMVGFGGNPSFPALAWAVLLGIPFILHEQNVVVGRVNRRLGRWARWIGVSTARVTHISSSLREKVRFVGMPVRPEIQVVGQKSYRPFGSRDRIYLTVLGGSAAAQIFSEVLPSALAFLPESMQKRITVTQQCRPEILAETREAYEKSLVEAHLAPFFEEIPEILKRSHLVITRAGASTIGELVAANRPGILVPYPWATEDHQTLNAQEIEAVGGGWCVPQGQLSPSKLGEMLRDLFETPGLLLFAAERLRGLAQPQAAQKLADLVMEEQL